MSKSPKSAQLNDAEFAARFAQNGLTGEALVEENMAIAASEGFEPEPAQAPAPATTRTRQHIVKILVGKVIPTVSQTEYYVYLDGKLTTSLLYMPETDVLMPMPFPPSVIKALGREVKKLKDNFSLLYIAKSPDLDVVSAQADQFVAASFIRTLLDQKIAREAKLKAEQTAEK